MASLSKDDIMSFLFRRRVTGKSKMAHEIAVEAYKRTNGPTPDLRRVYDAYRMNSAKSRKHAGDQGSDR